MVSNSWSSGKTNGLLNLITHQPDIDKIYLFIKNLYETKYQLTKAKVSFQSIALILKLLLKTIMVWMIFTKIWMNTIQIKTKNIDRIWWYDCWYIYQQKTSTKSKIIIY